MIKVWMVALLPEKLQNTKNHTLEKTISNEN